MRGKIGVTDVVQSSDSSTSIAVASTATVYSKSFPMKWAKYFGLWYKATSDGTVAIDVELEESYLEPTTEGSADTNYAVPENMQKLVSSLADETAHVDSFGARPMPYGRLKITGLSGNDASTVIVCKIAMQD